MGIVGLMLVLAAFFAGGCGGSDPEAEGPATTAASSASSDAGQPEGDGEGVKVAEEILATFDELVGKVAEIANAKPEPAVLAPQLEELYESYVPTMTELNGMYLALRDSDVVQWGACNTYLGENRGKHVFDKDTVLTEAVSHYNLQLGDQEMVALISKRPVELLDIAVAQD